MPMLRTLLRVLTVMIVTGAGKPASPGDEKRSGTGLSQPEARGG